MGDRTPLQAIIHDCPPAERVHVAELLAEYIGEDTWGSSAVPESVELGETYLQVEASCGSATELAEKLEAIPGITFQVWEDPYGQYLGDAHFYTPELGSYWAPCDADGWIVLSYEAVAEAIKAVIDASDSAMVAAEELAAAVAKLYGRPWLDAMRGKCGRCGGKRGEDLTCPECTDTDGNPKSTASSVERWRNAHAAAPTPAAHYTEASDRNW